jgi:phosphoribosylamine--glycine ligase
MKVLLLGSGAREHALAWRIAQSRELWKLWCAPGNPGMEARWKCCPIDPSDSEQVCHLALQLGVDLVVVGPEGPLVKGIADALRKLGIAVFGPDAAAARIEGSKAWAKEVMAAAKVPTAHCEVFTDLQAAEQRAKSWGRVVVKADGLAAGKGVVVADSGEEAAAAVRSLGKLPAGSTLLLEERLVGPELSVIALCDGERFVLLPPAQDHKRLLDGDQGPNTGGMGAYAPANLLSAAALDDVGRTIIAPTLAELGRRGSPFRGALFAGLMLTSAGPRVIEFNCRMGDPETQPLMMQLDEDLLPLLAACAAGRLTQSKLKLKSGAAVAVVLAAAGYPEAPRAGDPIEGLEAPAQPGVEHFFAGVRREAGALATAGGRVLTVCAHAPTFEAARAAAYAEAERIGFAGKQYRKDIGAQAR